MSDRVLDSVADGVGHIHLNRPDAADAVDLETTRSFGEEVDRVNEDDVLVELLTSAGARFCPRGDMTSLVAQEDAPAYGRRRHRTWPGAPARLHIPPPTRVRRDG